MRQQKVVVIGNVESQTLLNKLVKTGKHAELWPEKADSKEKKRSKGKKKDKQSEQESSEESNHGDHDKEKETVQDPPKNGEGGNVTSEGGKTGGQAKEPKPEVKQNVTVATGSQTPLADQQKGAGDGENGNEKSGGGGGGASGGKKKKKKGQKVSQNIGEAAHSGDAPPGSGSPPNHGQGHGHGHGHDQRPIMTPIPAEANYIHPSQHMYQQQYPSQYYEPPVYGMSYSRAHPVSSHVTSYVASPPPRSYTYVHHPVHDNETEPPPSDYYGTYSSHPSADSFELFSDENPNGCSVM